MTSDPALLSRVLTNLVKNALEASAVGEIVTLTCRSWGEFVEFSVHNPSVMPPEVRRQIFQRSFSTKGAGRGLGTYSVKLLTERYLGGTVDFDSVEGEGTTFRARYPRFLLR
jgi:signal transduction histidine kinase